MRFFRTGFGNVLAKFVRLSKSKGPQRFEHSPDPRHLVRPKQISFAKRGQDREESFGGPHFLPENLERVRKRVTDRKPKSPQSKCIQEDVHLVSHAHAAVLQVPIIKAQAGIDQNFFHTRTRRSFNFTTEISPHQLDGIATKIKISDLADVAALHVTNDDAGVVFGYETVN